MSETVRIGIDEIKELCMRVFNKHKIPEKGALVIFNEYLDGELRGRKCHGFAAFKKFGVKLLKARLGEPKIEKDGPSYTLINGMGCLGQLVCKDAMNNAIEKAKKNGISMVGLYNMHSYLMPGTYARIAAEKDMVAFIFNYGGRERIAPYGSIDPVFGTNPIAIGIPYDDFPIVVDMATSKKALGLVRLALKLGKKLDGKWGIDKDGKPTDDPEKALEGAVMPFGEHKGSALAFAVEILTRPLFGFGLNDGKAFDEKTNRGFLFIVMDPSVFIDLKSFKENTKQIVKKIKNSRKAKGIDEIFVPGERSERIKRENLKNGYLEIDKKIIDEIKGMV
jgi:L-2-hydroxycarboxylate dehydrogenase (NAD+)